MAEATEEKEVKKNNRFATIRVIAQRVRQLEKGAPPMTATNSTSLMDTVMNELHEGKIEITVDEKGLKSSKVLAEESAEEKAIEKVVEQVEEQVEA